jgi:tetratricopeptide (TPR) repeat protein
MKYFTFAIIICILLFNVTSVLKAEPQNNQSVYLTENENMEIRTIDPVPLLYPTENEEVMVAYNTGTHLMRQNRLNEAEIFLLEAIELDPTFVAAIDHLGIIYRRQNRLDEAEVMYLRSIEINSMNIVPFLNLAIIYRIQSRLNDAFELYRHVVNTHPNNPEGFFGIGAIFFVVENYEDSMAFINRAIELYMELNSPLIYNAFYYKGMIYFRTGDYDEALFYLEASRRGNPDNESLVEQAINEIKRSN